MAEGGELVDHSDGVAIPLVLVVAEDGALGVRALLDAAGWRSEVVKPDGVEPFCRTTHPDLVVVLDNQALSLPVVPVTPSQTDPLASRVPIVILDCPPGDACRWLDGGADDVVTLADAPRLALARLRSAMRLRVELLELARRHRALDDAVGRPAIS